MTYPLYLYVILYIAVGAWLMLLNWLATRTSNKLFHRGEFQGKFYNKQAVMFKFPAYTHIRLDDDEWVSGVIDDSFPWIGEVIFVRPDSEPATRVYCRREEVRTLEEHAACLLAR